MYHFLVNPSSCSGKGGKYWELLKCRLDERGVSYQVHFSSKPGDMARTAAALTGGADGSAKTDEVHLVVLGGDGTVNEAIQGIRDFEKTLFSYIPTGSGNDLARDTGISRDPEKALLKLLDNGRETRTDVGILHYHNAYVQQDGEF